MKKQADVNQITSPIEDFLAQKRIAIVGISHDPSSLSVALYTEFSRRGYKVALVNPNVREVQGKHCFARVQEVQPAVGAALLMTSPEVTNSVVRDCAAAGIRRVWMYRGTGQGAVSEEAVEFCREQGMLVIPGECPFMFLPGSAGVHRFHGFVRKITGNYPQRLTA